MCECVRAGICRLECRIYDRQLIISTHLLIRIRRGQVEQSIIGLPGHLWHTENKCTLNIVSCMHSVSVTSFGRCRVVRH